MQALIVTVVWVVAIAIVLVIMTHPDGFTRHTPKQARITDLQAHRARRSR